MSNWIKSRYIYTKNCVLHQSTILGWWLIEENQWTQCAFSNCKIATYKTGLCTFTHKSLDYVNKGIPWWRTRHNSINLNWYRKESFNFYEIYYLLFIGNHLLILYFNFVASKALFFCWMLLLLLLLLSSNLK